MNKIKELTQKIMDYVYYGDEYAKAKDQLRTLLTAYTKEVAKIDDVIMKEASRSYLIENQRILIRGIYNRLIEERYSTASEKETIEASAPHPDEPLTLQVGWEYRNGRGEWREIKKHWKNEELSFEDHLTMLYTSKGVNSIGAKSPLDLILSTGRPISSPEPKQPEQTLLENVHEYLNSCSREQLLKDWQVILGLALTDNPSKEDYRRSKPKQPEQNMNQSVNEYLKTKTTEEINQARQAIVDLGLIDESPSNWWESLKEGDLVKREDQIFTVTNWFQEQLGDKKVWIETDRFTRPVNEFTTYTPTIDEAIQDYKDEKINQEEFRRIINKYAFAT